MFPKWEYKFPQWEERKNKVRIISRPTLIRFWKVHPDAEQPIKAWYNEAKKAQWGNSSKIKKQYLKASILKNGRVIFNIGGNKYRLIVAIHYTSKIVYIRFIGTHQEHDLINAEII